MKYQIVKALYDGSRWYIIQYRRWWSPFWATLEVMIDGGYDGPIYTDMKFFSKSEAEKYLADIYKQIATDKLRKESNDRWLKEVDGDVVWPEPSVLKSDPLYGKYMKTNHEAFSILLSMGYNNNIGHLHDKMEYMYIGEHGISQLSSGGNAFKSGSLMYLVDGKVIPEIKGEELLDKMIAFATKKHEGQFKRDGKTPYITHPLAVAAMLQTEDEKIVAIGHGLFEDTDTTEEELRELGVSLSNINSIRRLTKHPGQSYEEYLRQVGEERLASKVKIAVMFHNISDSPADKQKAKYIQGLAYLLIKF